MDSASSSLVEALTVELQNIPTWNRTRGKEIEGRGVYAKSGGSLTQLVLNGIIYTLCMQTVYQ